MSKDDGASGGWTCPCGTQNGEDTELCVSCSLNWEEYMDSFNWVPGSPAPWEA